MTQRVRFSMSGVGSGSDDVEAGWWPKNSSATNRGWMIFDGSGWELVEEFEQP